MKYKIFLLSLVLIILMQTYAYAETIVTSYDAEVNILENGSAEIIETIDYRIDEEINGQFRTIDYKNSLDDENYADSVSNFSIEVDGVVCEKVSSANNGDKNVYTFEDDGNSISIKLYMPTSYETRSVIYRYTLDNVINKYNDVAEFYWNFISSGWEYSIEDLDITISIPREVDNIEELRVWGHGELYGESSIVDERTVNLRIGTVYSSWVAARVAFPSDMINDEYSKTFQFDNLENIIDEETYLADAANREREEASTILAIFVMAIILEIVLMIAVPIYYWRKYDKELKPEFMGDYYRELPTDCTPAIMSYLMTLRNVGTQNILATILDLSRKKYITIESEGDDYRLTLINKDFSNLRGHEKYFIEELIFNDRDTVTIKQIEKENKDESKARDFTSKYNNWEKEVKKETDDLGYIDKTAEKKIKGLYVWGIIFIILGIISFANFILIFEGIMLFILGGNKKRTRLGIEEYAKWKAFKKFLLDFGNMKEYDIPSLIIWEHYLVYATALKIAEKVIKNLKIYLTAHPEYESTLNTVPNMWIYSNINTFNSVNKSFSSPLKTARSTIAIADSSRSSGSGSGGGFSGGGGYSGGGGGGSHGSF